MQTIPLPHSPEEDLKGIYPALTGAPHLQVA